MYKGSSWETPKKNRETNIITLQINPHQLYYSTTLKMQLTTFIAVLSAAAVSASVLPRDGQLDTAGLTACGFQCYQQNVALAATCDPADMLCLCMCVLSTSSLIH
jgi:hypothetical protein